MPAQAGIQEKGLCTDSKIMKRFHFIDAVLLFGLGLLWLACFGLHVSNLARARLARVPVYVSAPDEPDGYPAIRGFRPGTIPETSDLTVGDTLIRVGETDLRGVGSLGFVARVYQQLNSSPIIPVTVTRDSVQEEKTFTMNRIASSPADAFARTLPLTLGFFLPAIFVLIREAGSRAVRAFFLACLAYSIHWAHFPGGSHLQTYAWMGVFTVSSLVMFPLVLRAVLVFPEHIAPTGARIPAWPWLFAVFGPLQTSTMFGVPPLPPTLGLRVSAVVTLIFVATLLWSLARIFRQANPVGRRQMKWVVYGFYVGTAPVLTASLITTFDPSLWWIYNLSISALALVPLSIVVAIIRDDFFDIDRLISVTAATSILFFPSVVGLLLLEPGLSEAASRFAGVDPQFSRLIVWLFYGYLIVLGQRSLRPWIERRFFPERYTLEQGMGQMLQELATPQEPRALLPFVGKRLEELLHPENCVIYECREDYYVAVFVSGSVATQALPVASPLVGSLQIKAEHPNNTQWRRFVRDTLSPQDRTELAHVPVEVVLTIGHSVSPPAFICLGKKRSGDIYTTAELQLLDQVADRLTRAVTRSIGQAGVSSTIAQLSTFNSNDPLILSLSHKGRGDS
jgi:hypothetical protein